MKIGDYLDMHPEYRCALVRLECPCGMGGRVMLAPLPAEARIDGHACPVCRKPTARVAELRHGFGRGTLPTAKGGAS